MQRSVYNSDQTETSSILGQLIDQSNVSNDDDDDTPLKEAYRQHSTDLSDVERSLGDIPVQDARVSASKCRPIRNSVLEDEQVPQTMVQWNSLPINASGRSFTCAESKAPNYLIHGEPNKFTHQSFL